MQESWSESHGGCTRIFPPQLQLDGGADESQGIRMCREERVAGAGEGVAEVKAGMCAAAAGEAGAGTETMEGAGAGAGSRSGGSEVKTNGSSLATTRDDLSPTDGRAIVDVRTP